jgi:UDP-N-acetylglucosamine 3-dehydrogenase
MLKVGVVGCGGVGLLHSKAYLSHPQANLVCVCDMVKEKADARAKDLGVKAYYSVKEMLSAEPALDAVGVITADHLHFEPAMEALDAGKHVLVEKPLSLIVKEAEQMVRKAEEKGVNLAIDYNRRYAPPYLKAKEWIDDGTIGNVAYVMMKLSQGGPNVSHKGKYYLLYELETHAMDMIRHLGGDIAEVSAEMASPRGGNPGQGEEVVYNSIAVSMKFTEERVAVLMASWDSAFTHPIEIVEICGSKGYMQVNNIVESVSLYPHGDPVVRTWKPSIFQTGALTFDKIFENRVHAFVNDLNAGKVPAPTGLDGLKAIYAIESAIKSFEEKKVIKVPEWRG